MELGPAVSGGWVKVLVVDDEPELRRVLRYMLEAEDDIDVVGEASSAEEALGQAASTFPDVILMDIHMGQTDGIQAIHMLKADGFVGSVLVFSAYDHYLRSAIQNGAAGYVLKGASREELISCIRRSGEGGFIFGSSIMDTSDGFKTAIDYLGGRFDASPDAAQATQPSDEEGKPTDAVEPPGQQPSDADRPSGWTGGGELVSGEVDLIIPASSSSGILIELYKWLLNIPGLGIREMDRPWSGNTVLKAQLVLPVPLVERLLSSPYVTDVVDESLAAQGAPPKDELTGLSRRVRQFRLTLAPP